MRATLEDLPIKIGFMSTPSADYVRELKAVTTPEELIAHTERWRAIWLIPWERDWEPSADELAISEGRYDTKEMLDCIEANRRTVCPHMEADPDKGCLSALILVPSILIMTTDMAKRFGAFEGTAMIQMQRALREDVADD